MFTDDEIVQINKVQQLIRRKARSNSKAFTDPSVVKDYLMNGYAVRDSEREVFRIIYLDTQHRMITDEALFYGTIDASPVYPRVVVQRCLQHNAAAVIFSHNHPSGVAEPSQADRNITNRLKDALQLVDIRVLDHIVCGDASTVSFAERGFL